MQRFAQSKKALLWEVFAAAVAASAVASAVSPAQAADSGISIYGVALGQPLPIPQCAKEVTPLTGRPGIGTAGVGPTPARMCFASWDALFQSPPQDGSRRYFVFFGPVKPAIADELGFNVTTLNGTVQDITVTTAGLAVQDNVVAQLAAKFGQPTSMSRKELRIGVGTTESAVTAIWRKNLGNEPAYIAFVAGIESSPNTGRIFVRTEAAEKRSESEAESAKKFLDSLEPKL